MIVPARRIPRREPRAPAGSTGATAASFARTDREADTVDRAAAPVPGRPADLSIPTDRRRARGPDLGRGPHGDGVMFRPRRMRLVAELGIRTDGERMVPARGHGVIRHVLAGTSHPTVGEPPRTPPPRSAIHPGEVE